MSAINFFRACPGAPRFAVVGMLAFGHVPFVPVSIVHLAFAQSAPTVTDADIERAKQAQPIISEQDIERAQKKYRMPDDAELRRAPIPSTPNIDALPRPGVARPLDLEAIAKGYENSADAMAQAQAWNNGPGLLIFISFSMPEATLKRLVEQAARAQASLVIRGLVNGSLRYTVARTQALIGNRQLAVQIDPQAFDRFAIKATPSFVLVRDGAKPASCASGACLPADTFAATAGDVSLDYALEHIQRAAPKFSADAARFLKRIRG